MKVVIVGGGNVGTFIAEELTKGGHDVTIVEVEADRVARAERSGEPAGVRWVLADACEVDNLRKVPLDDVDVLAAVTGDDEDNLVVSLLSKQEFAVPRVIARVNNPKNHWMFNENWGVDVAVSTPHLLTSLVEEAVSVGTLVRLLSFERGRASLIEVTLAERRQGGQPGDRGPRLPARLHDRRCAARGAGDLPPRRHAPAAGRRGPRARHPRQRGQRPVDPHRARERPMSDPPDLIVAAADLRARHPRRRPRSSSPCMRRRLLARPGRGCRASGTGKSLAILPQATSG